MYGQTIWPLNDTNSIFREKTAFFAYSHILKSIIFDHNKTSVGTNNVLFHSYFICGPFASLKNK